jgi:hypothetical protein
MKIYNEDDGPFEWLGKIVLFNLGLFIIGFVGLILLDSFGYDSQEKKYYVILSNSFLFILGLLILISVIYLSRLLKREEEVIAFQKTKNNEDKIKIQFNKDLEIVNSMKPKDIRPVFYNQLNKNSSNVSELKKSIIRYHDYIINNEQLIYDNRIQKVNKFKNRVKFFKYLSIFLIIYPIIRQVFFE